MDTSSEAIGIAETIKKIQEDAKFYRRGWHCNEEIVVRAMGEQESSNKLVRLEVQPDYNTKTLGLLWYADARTYKPFVDHRLGEIDERTKIDEWKWLLSALNVIDNATRD
ncbi:hypothetical protein EVAR_20674_1 [Eumeta japonica]|uniref:Uncharacterized protein n=1 Tax=Eumeta variegata TaxID=151549 RepID=A0A4C1V8X2_EUMVA|nr:hypothetical protein EVAR_20674_1 [Eumeta japonica]